MNTKQLTISFIILFVCFWIEYQFRVDMQAHMDDKQDVYEAKVLDAMSSQDNDFRKDVYERLDDYESSIKYLIRTPPAGMGQQK